MQATAAGLPPRLGGSSNRVHPLPEPPAMPAMPPALRLPAAPQPSQGSAASLSGSPSWSGMVQRLGGLLGSGKETSVVFTGDLEEDVERMLEEEERAEAAQVLWSDW